jgi:hypothetical protein
VHLDETEPWLLAADLLRDAENHHRRGVHDADEDLGEPDCWIGKCRPSSARRLERTVVYSP